MSYYVEEKVSAKKWHRGRFARPMKFSEALEFIREMEAHGECGTMRIVASHGQVVWRNGVQLLALDKDA